MTTESSENGAITLSRMKFSGYAGHATIFSWMLTTVCCFVVELRVRFSTQCLKKRPLYFEYIWEK